MRRRHHGDRGSQFVEYAAYLPIFLIFCVLVMEMFLSFLAMDALEGAARAGAREAGSGDLDLAHHTARQHLPSYLERADVRVGREGSGVYAEVEIDAPILNPSMDLSYTLKRRVEMPAV